MTLKSLASRLTVMSAVLALLICGSSAPLWAQTFTHNTTTLAAAQTATDTTISLTAVSAASGSSFGAVQAGQLILVDQELETFVSVTATSTIWNVTRSRARSTAHATLTQVYIGAAGSFQQADPPAGSCTTASQPKFWINLQSGGVFSCGTDSKWAKAQGPYFSAGSGSGATVTLTTGDAGKTFLFDRAAGIVYTLPAPQPGMTFDFVTTVTITSNAATVVTNAGTVFVVGVIHTAISGGATGSDWACNGTTHIKVTSNGTTSGGILGSRLHFTAVSSTVWQVDGLLVGSGTEVTPCST